MSNILQIDAYLPELGKDRPGISRPVTVICNDGNTYLLKNQNTYYKGEWVNFNCVFFQEMFVYNIAKYLGLSVPEMAIIDVDKGILDQYPTLTFSNRFQPGLHFATKLIDNVENNLMTGYQMLMLAKKKYIKTSWNTFFKNIHNKDDIPKLIALDLLTLNFDRFTNVGNLLVANNSGNRIIYAIDHGHCFGNPMWDFNKQKTLKSVENSEGYKTSIIQEYLNVNEHKPLAGLGVIFKAIEELVDFSNSSNHSFMEAVYLIENITSNMIDKWFLNIPKTWYINEDKQKAYYKKFILVQKNNLRGFITKLVDFGAFSNVTGGDLKWIENRTGTQ